MTDPPVLISRLGALAQTSRLNVVERLIRAGPDGVSVGRLAAETGIPRPTLSIHLQVLLRAGLVSSRKDKQSVYYSANADVITSTASELVALTAMGPPSQGVAA